MLRFESDLYNWAATVITTRSFPASASSNSSLGLPVLIPGLDLLNHSPFSRITWDWWPTTCAIRTDEELLEGSQIFNNYGPKENEECQFNSEIEHLTNAYRYRSAHGLWILSGSESCRHFQFELLACLSQTYRAHVRTYRLATISRGVNSTARNTQCWFTGYICWKYSLRDLSIILVLPRVSNRLFSRST